MSKKNIVIGDLVTLTESALWNLDSYDIHPGIGLVVDTKSALHGFPVIAYVHWPATNNKSLAKPINTRWLEVFHGNR